MSEEYENPPAEEPKKDSSSSSSDSDREAKPKEAKAKSSSSASCGAGPWEAFCEPFEKSEFFGEMKKIFMWEDLMTTLLAFCVVNVFFFLILYAEFTVIGLFCWVCFFALLAGLVFDIQRVIGFFKDEDVPSKLADKNIPVPEKYITGFFDFVSSLVKAFIGVGINTVLVRSVPFSLGMVFGLLFMIYLAGHCSFASLVYVSILFCFIWFRLYHDKKDTIDKLWEDIKAKVKELFEKAKQSASNKAKGE